MITNNPTDWNTPRSQKAKGYQAIFAKSEGEGVYYWKVPAAFLIQSDQDLEEFISRSDSIYYKFARPCPTVPRHGFVDSRRFSHDVELRGIWRDTLAADPNGEMLIMEAIDAECSAIYSPGGMFYGPGNDGATAGIDSHSVFLPTHEANPDLLARAGIKEGDSPYFELVWPKGDNKPKLVQLRGGPKIESAVDYIPYDISAISKIVIAKGVGLEWEDEIARQAQTPEALQRQLVVYDSGGNQASHYAAHCKVHNIPYVASFEPEIGMPISCNIDKDLQEDAFDIDRVMLGLHTGIEVDVPMRGAVNAMLLGLHTFGSNVHIHSRDFNLGVAAAICMRLGSAASLGEYRHHMKNNSLNRAQIFDKVWDNFFLHQKRMTIATRSFFNSRWRSGYGGPKWGECAINSVYLWLEALEFLKDPNSQGVKHILTALNRAVNVAHNGGWLFNKFTNARYLDEAGRGEPRAFVRAIPTMMWIHEHTCTSLGWRAMRRPRAFRIREDDNGVRVAEMRYERHANPNVNRAPAKILYRDIRAVLNGDVLHIQYRKSENHSQYAKLDIPISTQQRESLSDKFSGGYDCNSMASNRPYIRLEVQEINGVNVLAIKRNGYCVSNSIESIKLSQFLEKQTV